MKCINKIIILLIIVIQATLHSAPSVRSKSRVQNSPTTEVTQGPIIQKNILSVPIQSTQEEVKTIPNIPQLIQEPSEQPTLSEQQPKPTDLNQQDPIHLYQEKLVASSYLTRGIVKYFFDAALTVATHEKNKNNVNKQLREIFNGLRYPLHRHMREFVSAYNDSDSFLNGLIEASITSIDGHPEGKKTFIENLNKFALNLKGFKVYHIDQRLDDDIKTHLQNLNNVSHSLMTAATTLPLLKDISKALTESLEKNYETNLVDLQKYLNNQTIKSNLPAREGSIKYIYRGGRKTVLGVTGYLYRNVKEYAERFAVGQLRNAFTSPLKTAAYLKSLVWNSPTDSENPTPETTTPEQGSQGIIQGLKGSYNYLTTTGATEIFKDIITNVTQNIKAVATDVAWPYFVDNYILPAIIKKTIVQIDSYFYKIPGSQNEQSLSSELLNTLAILNSSFMNYSSNFITKYVNDLVQNLSIKIVLDEKKASLLPKDVTIEIITKALQSAQIEIFRHRRTIISELSNPKSFTGNYINYLHSKYIHDHNSNFTPEELKGKYEPRILLIEKSSFPLGDESQQDYLKATKAGEEIISNLSKRVADDPRNSVDLIKLQGPLKRDMIKQLIESFEHYNENIINELKAFGARSHNKLVQNYWLSVIDKDYSKKLTAHLRTLLSADDRGNLFGYIGQLLNQADYKLPLYDADGAAIYYADGQPIFIPQPQISPLALDETVNILITYYIRPLDSIAALLQQEPLYSQLPQGKSWWVKYPAMTAKLGIRGSKFIIKKIVDEALVPVIIAFATGGSSLAEMTQKASEELMKNLSFSGVASSIIGFDYKTKWEYLCNPRSWGSLSSLLKTGLELNKIRGSLRSLKYRALRPLGQLARE